MKKNITLFLLTFLLLGGSLLAQIKRADKLYHDFAYQGAIEAYQHALKKDTASTYIVRQLATASRLINDTGAAEKWYATLLKTGDTKVDDYLFYAQALQSNGKYVDAKTWMDKYLELTAADPRFKIDVEEINQLKRDSVRYMIEPVTINSGASDFGVTYYSETDVVFASAKPQNSIIKREYQWNNQDFLRLYLGYIEDNGDISKAKIFSPKLETVYHDGPVCFSKDGNEMFITRNFVTPSKRAKRNELGVVDIKMYYSKKNDKGKWTKAEPLPFNLEEYSTGHPSISADGKKLYFISDRPGGYGGTDLYVITREGETWGEPENLGTEVNTSQNEMFPFISNSGVLYFSSKGFSGLGGLDIYCYDKEGGVSNIGYPVNSSKDDFCFVMKGINGYFSTNRNKGKSYDDIYRFKVKKVVVHGKVLDKHTKNVIPNSTVSLYNGNGDLLKKIETGDDGKYRFLLSNTESYRLTSVKKDYADGEITITPEDFNGRIDIFRPIYMDGEIFLDGSLVFKDKTAVPDAPVIITRENSEQIIRKRTNSEGQFDGVLMRGQEYSFDFRYPGYTYFHKKVKVSTHNVKGDTIYVHEILDRFIVEDIFYDFNKWNIRPDAAKVLDKLVKLMKEYKTMKIELGSHTDSRGSNAYNLSLSWKRASSAVDYIINHGGISPKRITARGYGELQLVNKCKDGVECTDAQHQANRRTEVKIIDM